MIVRDCTAVVCKMLYCMEDGSETWPIRKENEVALQQAEMRMVRWMCDVKLQDRVPSKGLRQRLGLDDIISVLQQNRLSLMVKQPNTMPRPSALTGINRYTVQYNDTLYSLHNIRTRKRRKRK